MKDLLEILLKLGLLMHTDALMDGQTDIMQTPTPSFPSPFETAALQDEVR